MRHESLSPVLNKKDENGNALPNIITVSNNVRLADTVEKGAKVPTLEIKFPAETMSYPQYDSLEEFEQDCGSRERALQVINDVTQKFATSAGKAAIRTATTGDEDAIISAGCNVSRNFSWREEAKLSVKEKAANFDALVSDADKLSPEELLRRIMQLRGAK